MRTPSWLRPLATRPPRSRPRDRRPPPRPSFRPGVEALEDRALPATWVPMPVPPDDVLPPYPPGAPTQTAYFLRGLWGDNPHDVFAVGAYRTILHYDGTAWAAQPVQGLNSSTATIQDPNITLYGVWGIETDGHLEVFATGNEGVGFGHIYHYSAGDAAWQEMPVPLSPSFSDTIVPGLRAIWGSRRDNVFVGANGGTFYHYDGANWSVLPRPALQGPGAGNYQGIWGNEATNDIVVATANNGLLHSADNGNTWQTALPISTTFPYGWNAVWGDGTGQVFAVGPRNGGTAPAIAHSSDFGATWPSQEIRTFSSPTNLVGVWGNSPQDVYAVGGAPAGAILHYDGSAWAPQDPGTTNGLDSIWGSGPYAFAAGANRTILTRQQATAFDSLSGPTISYGTASITLSGHVAGEGDVPPGSVAVTLDGVTQQAAIDPSTGTFSAVIHTATLPVPGSPYPITYSYPGDSGFSPAADTTKFLTVTRAAPTIHLTGGPYIYDGEPHPAVEPVTGVNGEDLGNPTYTYSYTDDSGNVVTLPDRPIDPGYYQVTASFAGNDDYCPASRTASVTIVYEARTLTDLSRAFNAGRTIPIKIQLTDASGNNLSDPNVLLKAVRLERVNADGSVTQVTLQDAGGSNPGDLFRYDTTLRGYIFNLSTKGLGAGTYNFYWMADGDPTEHELSFRLA